MNKRKINELTGCYEKWLIESLSNKEAAATFLKVAFEEYQKDNDIEALLLSVRHVAEAQKLSTPL